MFKSAFYIIQKVVSISRKDEIDSIILSIIIFSTVLGINILSIWGIVYKFNIIDTYFGSAIPIIIIFGTLIVMNFIFFLRNKNYLVIKNELENLNSKVKKRKILVGVFYFIISFVMFSAMLIIPR